MSEVLADPEAQQVLLRKCLIDMCYAINKFPKDEIDNVVVTIDSSSWRYNFYANYKYSLTKVRDEYYKLFLQRLYDFADFLRKKGIIVTQVEGCEGDDLLYIWSLYYGYIQNEKTVIITGDSDMRQLITDNVSIFCNNSKSLKMYCNENNEVYWNDILDTDVQVVCTDPFEVLMYKVIIGDTSDNIPKIKRGFGEKAFQKFLNSIKPYSEPKDVDLITMAQWIATRFADYIHEDYVKVLEGVLFNLQMVWLNVAVYNENNYINEDGRGILEHMLDNVNNNKNNYNYKDEYSLEKLYGMLINK
jgi:5'-3' exonuclease